MNIFKNGNIEYLDHLFIVNGNSTGIFCGDMYTCKKCKVEVNIVIENCYILFCRTYILNGNLSVNNLFLLNWPELSLNCEEQIIKNIIE